MKQLNNLYDLDDDFIVPQRIVTRMIFPHSIFYSSRSIKSAITFIENDADNARMLYTWQTYPFRPLEPLETPCLYNKTKVKQLLIYFYNRGPKLSYKTPIYVMKVPYKIILPYLWRPDY